MDCISTELLRIPARGKVCEAESRRMLSCLPGVGKPEPMRLYASRILWESHSPALLGPCDIVVLITFHFVLVFWQ